MRRGSKKSGGKWPKWAAVAGCWLLVAGLLLYRLASLTHGPSQEEFSISQQNGSLTAILRTPLFLPLHLLQWLIFTVTRHHGLYTLRVASVVFGLLAIAAFWYVARKWYGLRTGLFATVLFAASAWTLHVSRYGGDSVMYLWALPALLLLLVLWEKPHKTWLNTVVA
ncbi:MAG TPA: glycosyltransferase family 39 protein, partial [Candidatus Saccharimonadales bacterium]|nr:glycosyltransferase family 39 protein [Candidatus Saccharimonadales bacterium]